MSTLKIRTAQNVEIEHNLASVGDRLLGGLIDYLVIIVYFVAIFFFLFNIEIRSQLITALIFLIPVFFYSLLCEIFFNGQTLGKIAMKTRVVRLDGAQPTIGNYFVRWSLRIVDIWMFWGAVGILLIAATKKSQRLGDLAADTTVVKTNRRSNINDTLILSGENISSNYTPLFPEAEKMTDQQAALIKEALHAYHVEDNYDVIDALSRKLKEVLEINTTMPPLAFLQALLKDYSALYNR